MPKKKKPAIWLEGYYPPRNMFDKIGVVEWEKLWSTGAHASVGWVYFNHGDYTIAQIKAILLRPAKWRLYKKEWEDDE